MLPLLEKIVEDNIEYKARDLLYTFIETVSDITRIHIRSYM